MGHEAGGRATRFPGVALMSCDIYLLADQLPLSSCESSYDPLIDEPLADPVSVLVIPSSNDSVSVTLLPETVPEAVPLAPPETVPLSELPDCVSVRVILL